MTPRQPRVFAPDDPALTAEAGPPDAPPEAEATAPGVAGPPDAARPTLRELGRRGLRWGALLLSALAGAVLLGLTAWFARFVSAALARDDWMGWATLGLLAIAAFAAVMILLRELVGFLRLGRLGRLRVDIAAAIAERDGKRERKAARQMADLYAGRRDQAWNLRRFHEHVRDVHDPGELLALAEREIVTPLDTEAKRLVTRSAKRVATVTALSPMVLIAVGYVLVENLRLLRTLAALYGARPGFVGVMRLARMVFAHIVATGGVAMTDDLLGQFLGQDLLRRLSRRLGEGAFNGALTARIGVTALEVIRPMPFLAARPPPRPQVPGRMRDALPRGGISPASPTGFRDRGKRSCPLHGRPMRRASAAGSMASAEGCFSRKAWRWAADRPLARRSQSAVENDLMRSNIQRRPAGAERTHSR
jgi:putative membrane protein